MSITALLGDPRAYTRHVTSALLTLRHRTPILARMLLLALSLSGTATAHHSVTAVYDTSKTIVLVGDVRELQLNSPHSLLVVEVGNPQGQPVAWRGELPALVFLHRAGWTVHSLAVGEHIHLTGCPSRYNATDFYVVSITKSDGTQLPLLPLSAAPPATDNASQRAP
jgi:hypothetical protein